jgi:hypothetical protein
MRPNLDTLKTEIQQYLETEGFVIFHGHSRVLSSQAVVFWDAEHYPDYIPFIQAAKATGTKLVVLNQREFSADMIDDALEQLAVSDLPVEDQRSIERRLKDLRAYEGFTCAVELSFDYQGRIYLFDVQTEWYDEMTNLLEDLEFLDSDDDEEAGTDEGNFGSYFSKN